ncbi:MAG: TIGR00159 family protein [Candidatus Omnitrophica bacterium]|nr:TIGR00159 family protein [Candidatus Omnitrophota bacterium]MBU3934268.1 diadenylate cyclase CdaA [Candidatus Omnitrophota bacterium]
MNLSVIWRPVLEIIVLWYVFYHLLVFIKGTPAVQVLRGLIFLIILFFISLFIAQQLNLTIISWILPKLFAVFLLSFLIIFRPELRRGLAQLGQGSVLGLFFREERIIDEIAEAVFLLAEKKIGAIIALERDIGLKPYIESGVPLDSKVNSELINTIFMPHTPLHDGGIIIEDGRIVAAGCLFPLTQNPKISKTLGTRHRAAVGLTDETDALVIVVSEETGMVSLAREGKLISNIDKDSLIRTLNNVFGQPRRPRFRLRNLFSKRK